MFGEHLVAVACPLGPGQADNAHMVDVAAPERALRRVQRAFQAVHQWQAERVGYHWVPGHWVAHGPNYHWVEGHWA